METRNATVTKTSFNSYNFITCTMKEHAQCQLEPAFQAFFFLIWWFLPSFLFTLSIKHKKCWIGKRTDTLEPKRIKNQISRLNHTLMVIEVLPVA